MWGVPLREEIATCPNYCLFLVIPDEGHAVKNAPFEDLDLKSA